MYVVKRSRMPTKKKEKKPITKNWAGGVDQGEDLEFKLQYCKNK
jgi:hypothetical protein